MPDQGVEHTEHFHRGAVGAAMGILIVISFVASVALFVGAPGQVTLVASHTSTALPPQVEISLSLKNGGWVEVRADPVIRASFVFSNGSTLVKSYYFDAVTLGAGRVTLSQWVVALPGVEIARINVTAYLRMRGPVSEATRSFSVP